IKMQHVPYLGGAPAITATVAGETEITAISPLASLPQIEGGNLRALAAGSLARDPQFPDLPTVAESGFPGFEAIQWVGLLTTAGTPEEIVARLNAEVNRAIRDPDMVAKLAALGVAAGGGSPAGVGAVVAAGRVCLAMVRCAGAASAGALANATAITAALRPAAQIFNPMASSFRFDPALYLPFASDTPPKHLPGYGLASGDDHR